MGTATALSVPSSASAAQVARLFALSPTWSSSEPPVNDPITLAAASNSTATFELLQQRWSAGGTTKPVNAVWAADPFDRKNSDAVLQVAYPADSRNGAQFMMAVFARNASVETALLKYEVAFDPDFAWIRGGKLPGLYGAAPGAAAWCSGGHHGSDCFSARLMWRNRGAGEVYGYIPTYDSFCDQGDVTCNEGYGTSLSRGAWTFPRGGWTTITQLIALNTPGVANGLLYVWKNDTLEAAHSGIVWRTNESVSISSVFFSTFFGGSDDSYNSRGGDSSYFRRFEVWSSTFPSNTSGPTVEATFDGTASSSLHPSPSSLARLVPLALLVVLLLQCIP
ncbi:hypothetical protein JCM8208_005111 [Rhodotorula glutinis]